MFSFHCNCVSTSIIYHFFDHSFKLKWLIRSQLLFWKEQRDRLDLFSVNPHRNVFHSPQGPASDLSKSLSKNDLLTIDLFKRSTGSIRYFWSFSEIDEIYLLTVNLFKRSTRAIWSWSTFFKDRKDCKIEDRRSKDRKI